MNVSELRQQRNALIEAGQRHLGKFPDLYLSYWSFNNYKTCPQRFGLHILPRKAIPTLDDRYWSLEGSVVHSVFEDFVRGVRTGARSWDDTSDLTERIPSAYDHEVSTSYVDWKGHGIKAEDHRESALKSLPGNMQFLISSLEAEGLIPCDPSTIHTEVSFKTSLTQNISIGGRCDLVFEHPDSITIVDLKNVLKSSNVDWRQLIWYVLGLEPQFNKTCKRSGFLLTLLRQWSWRNPNAKTYRSDLTREIHEIALKIRRDPFRPIINRHHCSYCKVADLCPDWQEYVGRNKEVLDSIAILNEGVVEI